ncbi:unnamed protein product [Meloidogyne enterolobii]|uniref:Uncharacterized protein n=1 Tax=Meloidogyne enterolobii TaxID=390850 RepID=A0ACB1B6K0_MELEN
MVASVLFANVAVLKCYVPKCRLFANVVYSQVSNVFKCRFSQMSLFISRIRVNHNLEKSDTP